ncbi:MAG: MMPL family transporter [Acidimicrobiales bacterium]
MQRWPGVAVGELRAKQADRIERLATLVTGPMASWVGVAFWVMIAAGSFVFATKVGTVESSRLSAFLPSASQSAGALALDARFPSGRAQQAEIVFYRAGGLTATDMTHVAADRRALAERLGGAIGTPSTALRSPNGDVAVLLVSVAGNQSAVQSGVKAVRAVLGEGSGGLEIRVTGQAAIQADLLDAFSGADLMLLAATALLVAVLLAATYRSPVLWLVPLVCVGIAEAVAQAVVYGLGRGGLTVNSQSAALLTVIVFGAGTDYALLLTARYREELRRFADHRRAMLVAWRRATPAIVASTLTVAGALACMLPATLNLTTDFGIVGIVGVLSAAVVVLGAYPALLLVTGRAVFWPAVPRHAPEFVRHGPWAWMSRIVSQGRRPVWISGFVLLGGAAIGLFNVNTNVSALNELPPSAQSARGYELLAGNFPAGEVSPVDVVTTDVAVLPALRQRLGALPVTAALGPTESVRGAARFDLILAVKPTGAVGFRAVAQLRKAAAAVGGKRVFIGGPTAQDVDTAQASHHDIGVIVPSVLAVVLLVLWLVLRSVLAPLIVVATVVVTYGAALGLTALVFVPVLHLPGIDPTVPLLTFVFLVALGVDYNIFLLTRMREEVVRRGSTAGVAEAVASTGSVLSSAGMVLAGTFAVLALLPVVASREIGIVVAMGVLADTFLVRTVLVPTLAADLGRRFWWPTRPGSLADGRAGAPR